LGLLANFCDLASVSPKLYVVTEALGVFLCCVVIGTYQLDRSDDAPVGVNDFGSVLCHCAISPVLALILRPYFYLK
jgi:hypothetical protein